MAEDLPPPEDIFALMNGGDEPPLDGEPFLGGKKHHKKKATRKSKKKVGRKSKKKVGRKSRKNTRKYKKKQRGGNGCGCMAN